MEILYEDNHVLAVLKPAGLLVQGDRTGDVTLLELAKAYIKQKFNKPGNVFLGLVHRLDRPVSGVVMFARTSKAASRLSREFRARRVKKKYLAVVQGLAKSGGEVLYGHIAREGRHSRPSEPGVPHSKEALLSYRVLARASGVSLLEITPHTGRHHQIRLQLAEAGHPILGDLRYGAKEPLGDRTIALHAAELIVDHPTRPEAIRLFASPPLTHPWNIFVTVISSL